VIYYYQQTIFPTQDVSGKKAKKYNKSLSRSQ